MRRAGVENHIASGTGGAGTDPDALRVLHVDPGDGAGAFAAFLPDERAEVLTATRANDALDRLEEGNVDCLVTEYHLDDVDGVELCRIVREARPELPVILFTTERSAAVAGEAVDAGVTDYLPKGARPNEHAFLAARIEDAVARRRAERERDDLRRQRDLLADGAVDAFWDWNVETGEVSRDEGYASTFGYESVGTDFEWWVEAVHPEDRDRVREALDRALADPAVEYDETYRLRLADGSYGHVRSRGDVVYEDGEPVRMVGAHVDVTEREEYERRLERKNERLDEFASVVSHDLRNPLNVLDGALDLARETGDLDQLDRCRRAVDRMQTLIDDLLVLAREGESVGTHEAVDLRALAEDCWAAVETGDATLRVEADSVVRCDPGRCRQLLANLFRNSVEHGSTGSRTRSGDGTDDGSPVTVTVGDLDDGTGFYVADDGPGVPEADRERVFDSGYSTRRDGTGLGLAIVERVADAHGWDVRVVESAAGGARVEVRGA
ncbi:MAG: PAS domain-containing protein [Haloferacaceae archaeon]